jgi:nitrogen fixation/metabolism regulation signal transduction histidine kinase
VGLVIAGMASLLAFYIAARTIRPVEQLTAVVTRVAGGDLSARLLPTTHDEVARLTRAFNVMADQLHDKMTRLTEEREQLSAVLETWAAVIITDVPARFQINAAAVRIFHEEVTSQTGAPFAGVSQHELNELWEQCVETWRGQCLRGNAPSSAIPTVILTPLPKLETTAYPRPFARFDAVAAIGYCAARFHQQHLPRMLLRWPR